ncbi:MULTISPECIES: antA/AntB antirepressor family protein [unclassified Gilliamella]|uniref:antA/AntB antirepressor family protein n=1 Tax=unclassified Gilliamella TaxID=2685620 RepID=UPI00130C534A|nr:MULTISPECIES: antA/AntB antirepressor family protein [unclassified Gilliamella]MWP48441.1 hypothetical protein [Gilliamella sp. Lep-s35]MWP68280.1 hypothetical protein [Gilliamella sp. Lep-s5]MWP76581.1 hypothetical protein [Gilliamella sp. Lep-s21]
MTDFNNLVPVTETQLNGKLQQTVSAKALHNYLKVGNDFSTWIKGRIKEYGLIKNDDFLIFDSSEFRNQSTNNEQQIKWTTKRGGDRKSTDYILTIGTAKELAILNLYQADIPTHHLLQAENHFEELQQSILYGIGAIGNLMFWASENESYSEQNLKSDMRDIGYLLAQLRDVACFASNQINLLDAT